MCTCYKTLNPQSNNNWVIESAPLLLKWIQSGAFMLKKPWGNNNLLMYVNNQHKMWNSKGTLHGNGYHSGRCKIRSMCYCCTDMIAQSLTFQTRYTRVYAHCTLFFFLLSNKKEKRNERHQPYGIWYGWCWSVSEILECEILMILLQCFMHF